MTDDQHVRWIIEQLGTDEHGQLPGNWTMEVDFILPLLDKTRRETAQECLAIAENAFHLSVKDWRRKRITNQIRERFGLEDGDSGTLPANSPEG